MKIIKRRLNLLISEREKTLVGLLFKFDKSKISKLKLLDPKFIIKYLSSNYLIPALYLKLKKLKLTHLFENDFIIYIKKIYSINKSRNEQLIIESRSISKLFNLHKIEFSFLKGSALLKSNIYEIGERMIGDIDILVSKDQAKKAHKLLRKSGYNSKNEYLFWKTRHLPRLINPNKIFAVEIHTELIYYPKRKLLDPISVLKNSKKNIPDIKDLIKHCIYNDQINNFGFRKASFSLRSLMDYHKMKIFSLKKFNFNDRYFNKFILITNLFGISNQKIDTSFKDKLFILRFFFKRKNKIFFVIDEKISMVGHNSKKFFNQSIEFVFNSKYRENIIKK